ncbi:hypothetical protein BofuT4_uP159560.1 [Botrytis cinerea T4]|uniref:Uncharacterized protein n=1 Tax=Botryotinia fuckeliana (strain T4) TaxID=999810 RepID=G2YU37_BOTF4|nr:hypothetical protein BofuT4_uP159560.1 [Botrytis cinerea T4]
MERVHDIPPDLKSGDVSIHDISVPPSIIHPTPCSLASLRTRSSQHNASHSFLLHAAMSITPCHHHQNRKHVI